MRTVTIETEIGSVSVTTKEEDISWDEFVPLFADCLRGHTYGLKDFLWNDEDRTVDTPDDNRFSKRNGIK